MSRFIGLLVCLIVISTVDGQDCPPNVNDDIQRCVNPVAQFAEALGVNSVRDGGLASDRLIPSMGAEVFRDLCAKIATFTQCSQNARHQCPNHITLALINASYGYLCSDGYDVFMKHADCLMKLDQDPMVRICHDQTMADIKNVSRDLKSSMVHKLNIMCRALNSFAICVENKILDECGTVAWAVIERVLRDTTRTLVPSCEFTVSAPHAHHRATAPPQPKKPSGVVPTTRPHRPVAGGGSLKSGSAESRRDSDKFSSGVRWNMWSGVKTVICLISLLVQVLVRV